MRQLRVAIKGEQRGDNFERTAERLAMGEGERAAPEGALYLMCE